MKTPRERASRALAAVISRGITLDEALRQVTGGSVGRDRAFTRELTYGVCRRYFELEGLLQQLLAKPLKARDADVQALLLIGIYQMRHMRVPDHAAVGETVAACGSLGKPWARGLVNAVLRAYQSRTDALVAALSPAQRQAHPPWMLELIESEWPVNVAGIIAANNEAGPLTVRVNRRRGTREAWTERAMEAGLQPTSCEFSADGVTLGKAVDVAELPGFAAGAVSVQDEAAQLAASLLGVQSGERILDACAAPGGKTGHLLELCDGIELLALDSSAARLERVEDNLRRLGLGASVRAGDATQPEVWWDGRPFDRMLVDAPCSGSGVIRRHPDIKLRRTPAQLTEAGLQQRAILSALWPTLAHGGVLLYCTCSIFSQENDVVIRSFLDSTANAALDPIEAPWGIATPFGRQLLPTAGRHDGFYFARLRKPLAG